MSTTGQKAFVSSGICSRAATITVSIPHPCNTSVVVVLLRSLCNLGCGGGASWSKSLVEKTSGIFLRHLCPLLEKSYGS